MYVDLEDKDQVAVVDARSMKVVTTFGLGGKGGGPGALALDSGNGYLFVYCHRPNTCVDGKTGHLILATANLQPAKPGERRRAPIPGTFTLIEVGK